MYIIIDEHGKILQADEITIDDMNMADAGEIDLISTMTMTMYYNGTWNDIILK